MPPVDERLALHEASMRLAREAISKSLSGKDAYLIQAVRALDDLNEAFNVTSGRLAEWYAIHYPENRLRPYELIEQIVESPADSEASTMGAPMTGEDLAAIQGVAQVAKTILIQRKAIEDYISKIMLEIAPNLSSVLGPLLGARLIARAGSLEKLARMPASSIQVMGAGEALFKHLKAGTPSPKHGLIFKHPLISGAPKKARGKIARMLAGKAAIAARMDYYSGEVMDFGDLKAKASAIKSRSRGGKKP
ncbi:snoRNA binding protein Nop56 homolog [Methanocella paludicola SANAE]|uniref:SnoRNA binding protein Nop56 homolog n=1 Tax=Methanocella paludicola (strain DSM 17711 / JCM 13418 / NBRC 101707 / SANAE) TaxID=304371 RepID=D1YYV6_METPS|nr:NOP5/NOP56 family protein [Methanocella paludicola]BAI61628.1 snoRNA binding protein Nop56 homolog [Methanocella paludicola SANAE]